VVLDIDALAIGRGERVALMGPSGSGKSTLLNCCGGIERADGGAIEFGGEDLCRLDSDQVAALRRGAIGTVFQFFHLLPTLSVAENIELPLQLLGVERGERRRRVDALVEQTGIGHRRAARPDQLSGGEMQRCAIARALVIEPELLLADEPIGNLDSHTGATVLELLRTLCEAHKTALLMATHSAESTRICHRTLHMRDGRIVAEAATAEAQ